jgi:hypothetical protein
LLPLTIRPAAHHMLVEMRARRPAKHALLPRKKIEEVAERERAAARRGGVGWRGRRGEREGEGQAWVSKETKLSRVPNGERTAALK